MPLIAAALLVSACDYTRPFAEVCAQRLGPTEIHVTTQPVEYTTDHSVSSAELSRMGAAGESRQIVGLTHTTMTSNLTLGSNVVSNRVSHKECLRPIVNVSLAFAPTTVYISSDNQEGSCEYGVTMAHELRHVGVYREFLEQAAPEIEERLREYFGDRIFYFDNESEAQKSMEEQVRDRIGPFIEESMQKITEAQRPLDTQEEYDRLERSCRM